MYILGKYRYCTIRVQGFCEVALPGHRQEQIQQHLNRNTIYNGIFLSSING